VPSVNNRASTAVGGGLRAKPPPHKTRSSPIGYAQKPTSSHHHVAEVPLTVLSFSTPHDCRGGLIGCHLRGIH